MQQPAQIIMPDTDPGPWYTRALEHLVEVVQQLSLARDLDGVMAIVRKAARELTGADGATFVLRDADKCYYAEENAISPLWKGQRFPLTACISGWAMLNAQPAVIEDIYVDPRIPIDAYRPTFVKSLAMVPIRKEQPIGAIGNYWAKRRLPTPEEISILQALANVTSVTLENVDLYGQLQQKMRALEESNEELSRFAWSVAHDLKSPLRAIDNLSQWIAEDLRDSLNGDSGRNMEMLRKRVRRLEKLLDDILEYSHLEQRITRQDRQVDGAALMDQVLSLIHVPEGFNIEVVAEFNAVQVPLIPLQRILCNLIGNAIKHHDRKTGLIRVGAKVNEQDYLISVVDDGPGIAMEYHRKIFDMFQTLKPRDTVEGSGMGLAIVKKILALNGGDISVISSGRGAEFRFSWPKSTN